MDSPPLKMLVPASAWFYNNEEALHEHIHLENNIIFPRALELEKEEAI